MSEAIAVALYFGVTVALCVLALVVSLWVILVALLWAGLIGPFICIPLSGIGDE